MISIPKALTYALGALFSAYHVVLAILAFRSADAGLAYTAAIGLFVVASALSLWPARATRLPTWLACVDLVVALMLPLLVTSTLDASERNGYATWYVAAVGTLMTIACARRRPLFAWLGIGFLIVHTLLWAGPASLPALGVVGSVAWVAIAHVLSRELGRAAEEAHALESAERAAAAWRAAEEAHLRERSVRLGQTRSMAATMLQRIIEAGADLTEEERQECRYLEASVRDEIRGRRLLNDEVREHIIRARRRGVTVSVLDDGGLDHTEGVELAEILDELAEALAAADADRLVVRTGPSDSNTAVTLVGLKTADDGSAGALGHESTDDEVAVWVEIPRRGTTGP